jgi:WD40 repeat protein/GTPase SAR1 family protein
MATTLNYDAFVCYSRKDLSVAVELIERLKSDRLKVYPGELSREVVKSAVDEVENVLKRSRSLVLLISVNTLSTEWFAFERLTSLFRDPANNQRRFIPVRLDDSLPPDSLKQFAYIDWRLQSEEEYARLVAACRPSASKKRPTTKNEEAIKPDKTLRFGANGVMAVGVTPDGMLGVAGFEDGSVTSWDVQADQSLHTFRGHSDTVLGVAITPDGQRIFSGSYDMTLRMWSGRSGQTLSVMKGHTGNVIGIAIDEKGRRLVSGSWDNTVRLWDVPTGKCSAIFKGHTDYVIGVTITPDGKLVVSGSRDRTVRVWDTKTGRCNTVLRGHTGAIYKVAVTADGRRAVSGSGDKTLRLWDVEAGKHLATLEGHTDEVISVAMTPDGRRIVSGSKDCDVRIWDAITGRCITVLTGHVGGVRSVALTHDGLLAFSGSHDGSVKVWTLPAYDREGVQEAGATRYTNAKVLLVGETGVGKSGLAYRLAEDRFEATISTDAAWATQLKLPHETNNEEIEREIWLWDFAGQADYRLIHQLFMDETALAVLVFNPQSENPFEGLGQWDSDIERAARRTFRKLLVAGRCDRGGLMVSRASISLFLEERGFARYLETSAYTGAGCPELRAAIVDSIPWQDIPWTTSPRIFKLLKEEIVKLKDEGKVLLRTSELKQQLELRLLGETFTLDQLRAVVGLLASPGIVWQLEFGDFVLLQPERINAYAAAVIRKVRAHTEEIGVISEEDALAGRLDYQDMKRLPPDEEQIVLRAMHQTFIDHGLCLREPTEAGTLLVFPSYFKRERPVMKGHPAALVTYQFSGQLDDIYSTLVVRLHHTPAFEKDQLWRFAADFKTQAGKRVGLKMLKQREGAAELVVYFEPDISDDTKATFIRYVHEHLEAKAQEVIRLRHYICHHCHTAVKDRETALERLNEGKKDILCVKCEKRVPLWDLIEQKFASEASIKRVRLMEEQARNSIDNESKELILVGHVFAVTGEAGQIFRPTPNSDWGIDGEIEFKDGRGKASGRRVYLQLKSGDSYLRQRKYDGKEMFTIGNQRHVDYWQSHAYPVMLVIRTSDGQIRWMNVTDYLRKEKVQYMATQTTRQIIFEGEPFTALSVMDLRDKLFAETS